MNFRSILCYCFLLVFSQACKKGEKIEQYDIVQLKAGIRINAIHFIDNNIGFAVGGNRLNEGYIYKTIDAGKSWTKVYENNNKSVYEVYFKDSLNGFAGADTLTLLKTNDGGDTWYQYWFGNNMPDYYNERPAFKKIIFINDLVGFVYGGENYDKGIAYKTVDGGASFTYKKIKAEIKDAYFINENIGFLTCFGTVFKTTNSGVTYEPVSGFDNNFYKSVLFNGNTGYIFGNNSGIYKTIDNGNSWQKTQKQNGVFGKRTQFNAAKNHGAKNYLVGNNGMLWVGENDDWQKKQLENNHLFCIGITPLGKIFIGSEDGKIYSLNL